MIHRKVVTVLLSALVWFAVVPSPVSAEWFADLFVGPAFTLRNDVRETPAGLNIRLKDVGFDNSTSFGGRLGYWFESTPYLGFGFDVSHFRPDIGKQTVTDCIVQFPPCFSLPLAHVDLAVTGISFDAHLRLPLLTSKEFPQGQLQPYATIGPTIFLSRININDAFNFSPPKHTDGDASVGVKAGAGVAWQFHQYVALFAEYRFTHFRPEFVIRDDFVGRTPIKTNIDTHAAIFGVSFRFW